MPSGPQGTGWYGNVSPFAVYDRNGDGVITPDEYAAATGNAMAPSAPAYSTSPSSPAYNESPSASAYSTPSAGASVAPDYGRRADRRVPMRDRPVARYGLSGFSADTNPPVPPQ